MNKIILTGRLTNDLELKQSENGNIYLRYTIAVRRDKDTTDFINCTTFGEFAKTMSTIVKKGDMICLSGKLQISTYEKDGVKHSSYSVITDQIEFMGTKKSEETKEQGIKSISQDEIALEDSELPF